MNKCKSVFKKFRLTLIFAAIVNVIMFVTMILTFCGTFLLSHIGLIENDDIKHFPLFAFCIASILIGTVIAIVFSKKPLKPFHQIMEATDKIANGDYTVRLNLKGPEEIQRLGNKFNHMAEELSSVEMLRTDFVSNFSHEFKTPIVSIRGFAKALKWDDLTPEERDEYLDIIISESERLSALSLNVLYLSKIENQTILADKKSYNLSEQIRLAVALLDQKFSEKQLEIIFDAEEYFVTANEEMMKQVWINLLDNAVKFSPVGSKIEIRIKQTGGSLSVKISDQGGGMSPETKEHIFDKFYQGDLSHSTSGNGLGLTIVKKIIDLHNGNITDHLSDKGSSLEVILKNK